LRLLLTVRARSLGCPDVFLIGCNQHHPISEETPTRESENESTDSKTADTPDDLMRDSVQLVKEQADLLETIKDKESAEQARPRLVALNKRAKAIALRSQRLKLETLPQARKGTLTEKYHDDFKRAIDRANRAWSRLQKDRELRQLVEGMEREGLPK